MMKDTLVLHPQGLKHTQFHNPPQMMKPRSAIQPSKDEAQVLLLFSTAPIHESTKSFSHLLQTSLIYQFSLEMDRRLTSIPPISVCFDGQFRLSLTAERREWTRALKLVEVATCSFELRVCVASLYISPI